MSLQAPPEFSYENLIDGEWLDGYEKYFLDQFVLRVKFRGLKALTNYYLFREKDNNGIYVVGRRYL